tara:strand:+ start:2662 stop:3849 length:1188 start_codon:yes stop_codon:yes gene_type:complete
MLKGSIKTKESVSKLFNRLSKSNDNSLDDNSIIYKDFNNLKSFDKQSISNIKSKDDPFYYYLIDDELDLREKSVENKSSFIIFFCINIKGLKPFIEFKLLKYTDGLDLYKININNSIPSFDNYEYNGILKFNNEQYLFYKFNNSTKNIESINSSQNEYWTTIDDIINLQTFYNFKILNNIYYFLIHNLKALYLLDDSSNIIETPASVYYGDYYKKIGIIGGLGMPRSSPYASLGPYFYFGNYDRSLRFASITDNGKPLEIMGEKITIKDTPVYTKGGIVKFAIFLGKSKVMFNLPDDPKDDSDLSLELADKRLFIKDTLRLRDNQGKWTEEYNSVVQPDLYIYDRELKFDRKLDAGFIIEYFNQQIPINYAYFKTDHIKQNKKTTFYNVKDITMI